MNRFEFVVLAVGVIGVCSSCGAKKQSASTQTVQSAPPPVADLSGKFVFEPRLGTTYRHTMSRTESLEVVGTEYRSLEEWESQWAMSITLDGENYLYRADLEALRIQVDDSPVLVGSEVAGRGGALEVLLDRYGRLVDVRLTETLAGVLVDVAAPGAKPLMAAMFSPDNLRLLFAQRASERTQDLVGQSASVGASWVGTAQGPGGVPVAKKLVVTGVEDCGEVRCVRVERQLHPDRGRVWEGMETRVRAFVRSQGGKEENVELLSAEVVLKDELLVDPRRMEIHRATFEQSAQLKVRAPSGDFVVKSSRVRRSRYEY